MEFFLDIRQTKLLNVIKSENQKLERATEN